MCLFDGDMMLGVYRRTDSAVPGGWSDAAQRGEGALHMRAKIDALGNFSVSDCDQVSYAK